MSVEFSKQSRIPQRVRRRTPIVPTQQEDKG